MLEGFDFGSPTIASQLTGKLAAVKHYNALSIPPEFFLEAMDRLRSRYLNVPLDAVLHPASPSAQRAATEQKAAAETARGVLEEELTAQQWYERGFAATDPEQQVRLYDMAIRLKPDYADAFYNRALARKEKGDFAGALEDYGEAIRLKPDSVDTYVSRGILRSKKSDIEGALQDYEAAIRLRPDYAEAFVWRGTARCKKDDVDGALKDFEAALALRPDYAEAFVGRGYVRHVRADLSGALQDYDEAIRLKPDHDLAFYNRSLIRRTTGDMEGAKKDYEQAVRLGYKPDT